MIHLLLATGNAGKVAEMQAILAHLDLVISTPAQLDLDMDVREDGRDYASNAILKARAFARASGHWSLADDSGLEVDALDGAPGLHSARFAGPGRTDADRRSRLLELLADKPRPWSAQFRAVAALANPSGEVYLAEGICPGEIVPQELGGHGFGYDPIFLVTETGLTMAQMGMQQKNQLSHRARALQGIQPYLIKYLIQP